jgi:ribosome-associated protein
MEAQRQTSESEAKKINIEKEALTTLQEVVKALQEKKAAHIMILDVRGLSPLTDFLVIAEGNVERHVQTLAREVLNSVEARHIDVPFHEGLQEGSWVLLEMPDVMLHIMIPTWRQFYALERMWPKAKLIPLQQILSGEDLPE